MRATIVGPGGNLANVTADGKLQVEANVSVGSVTATDVTIKDPNTSTNKLAVNADGSVNVTLTGSSVALVNALQVRDTTTHSFTTNPESIFQVFTLNYRNKAIVVVNALDQAVSVNVHATLHTKRRTLIPNVSVAAGAVKFLTVKEYPELSAPTKTIDVDVKCTTAPTSGDVTIEMAMGG